MRALVLVVLAGCSVTARQHASRMLLGAAVITEACDWGSTRRAASGGWTYRAGQQQFGENNPALGRFPSTVRVDAYFAAVAIGTVAVGMLLPERFRPYWYGAVAVVEMDSVTNNLGTVSGACGLPASPAMAP